MNFLCRDFIESKTKAEVIVMRLAGAWGYLGLSQWRAHTVYACPLGPARKMTMCCPCSAHPVGEALLLLCQTLSLLDVDLDC